MASYITPEGFRRLQAEYDRLWKVERPRVTREVSEAAAQGDRSENAEYIYGKKRLREIDRRLRWLAKRMDELTVVARSAESPDRVYFGAYVTLEQEGGTREVQLVGPDESDPASGRVSIESPLGRSLLGRQQGDRFVLERPRGSVTLTVASVRYDEE